MFGSAHNLSAEVIGMKLLALALAAALALTPTAVAAADAIQIIAPNASDDTCLTMMGMSTISAVTMEVCESPRTPPQLWFYDEDSGAICNQGKCLFAADAGFYDEGAYPGGAHQGGSIMATAPGRGGTPTPTAFVFNSTTGAIAYRQDCNRLLNLQSLLPGSYSTAGSIATLWYFPPESGSQCRDVSWNEHFAMRS
jgi:hypothetical protein